MISLNIVFFSIFVTDGETALSLLIGFLAFIGMLVMITYTVSLICVVQVQVQVQVHVGCELPVCQPV